MSDDIPIREMYPSLWAEIVKYQHKRKGARAVYAFGDGPPTDPSPYLWPSVCGIRDVDAKYQEEYRVLGNRWRLYFVEERYCDRSYEANVVDVLKVIIGLK